ncbi:uncharacterized protein L201_008094 [Kwoniella dendrophila CBS 6074]|uniref:PCI domain-containing protein n=1 Tax=Kwoniella dendrophila CBS 6074 TaxID=1295534 RepID=A0AAX4K6E8_9TREE
MSQASSSSSRRRTVEDMIAPLDIDNFDWNAYEGTYQGRALITRLTHISSILLSSSSKPTPQTLRLARESVLRLIPKIKGNTWDYSLYVQVVKLLKDPLFRIKQKDGGGGIDLFSKSGGTVGGGDDIKMDVDETINISDERVVTSSTVTGIEVGGRRGEEVNGILDEQWIEDSKENERRENSRLVIELSGYLSNLIKESIRLTYLAFAQLSVKVGNSQAAMKNYGAVREYSTSPQHHVDLGVCIVETLLAFNLPQTLPGHISKLEATLDRLHPPPNPTGNKGPAAEAANVTASDIRERRENEARSLAVRKNVMIRIKIAKGLVALYNKEWSKAGRELSSLAEDEGGLSDFEGKAISSSDLALITAFCILASSDRDSIRRVLLERSSFKAQIDDSSEWIMDLIRSLVDANYGEVMRLLYRSEPILLLNPFLSSHTNILIDSIQTRCILQYVQPFSTIQIPVMANSFGLQPDQMLYLLEGLVESKEIKGKIDLIDQVLTMTEPDHRGEMFTNASKVGKKANDVTQSAILRMKMIEAGIVVDPRPPKSTDKSGTGIDEKGQLVLDEGLGDELELDVGTGKFSFEE